MHEDYVLQYDQANITWMTGLKPSFFHNVYDMQKHA